MVALSISSQNSIINGEDTCWLDIADRGLLYGDGVFTTMSVEAGAPLFLGRHLARLNSDTLRLNIPYPGDAILGEEARRLSLIHPVSVLKIMLTRGSGGRGYRCPEQSHGTRILSIHPKPEFPSSTTEEGITARFCEIRLGINPCLAGVKHLNRLEQVLARAEWHDEHIREGLMLDCEGYLVEGVMSNVFLVQDGLLRTPLLDRCGVSGVLRGLVFEAAKELGLAVEEARILPREVFCADELFITNSVIGVWPVSRLEGKAIPVGGVAQLLSQSIRKMALDEMTTESIQC